jgi:hypothetical protein
LRPISYISNGGKPKRVFGGLLLKHYMEHFTNISKYWKSIWKQFWFHGKTILKAPSILCQFPNYIASMLNFKSLKEQLRYMLLTHAPQSTSSSP